MKKEEASSDAKMESWCQNRKDDKCDKVGIFDYKSSEN